ncbi:MAG: Gfo/Idh/MocA family oxidoreductase [Phycisphaerae bacterium]|nr:Gfo/Idh/MocA family oxidoreductase [Phycisphaerae bacterium]
MMTEQKLKIAVIGLTEQSLGLMETAVESGHYAIAAVGDERQNRADSLARKYECPAFTDYRQLIIQTDADFLLFGTPVHQCIEFIRLGMQEKFHVLKPCPPALNFSQLAELYRLAKKEKVLFLTMQKGRFGLPFEHVHNYLAESNRQKEQSWHLISAVCHVPMGELEPEMRWLSDPNMAGGGVLLQDCYDLIDELLLCFGLPQKVYALAINQAPDRQQRMSLTEDTAIVTMQFTDALIAYICTSRTLGPARRHLRVHGKQQHLTATEQEVVLYDNHGNLLEQKAYQDDDLPSQKRMLENLAKSFIDPAACSLYPYYGFDLNTFAVIEAAYLSARTGMAEDPSRILKLAEINITELL